MMKRREGDKIKILAATESMQVILEEYFRSMMEDQRCYTN